jgi:hypothetical protein
MIVLDLFDEQTKQNGYYFGTSRKGNTENIPLLSLSIGVVPLNMPKLKHTAKVSELAAELKQRAKDTGHSHYVVDKRAS